MDEADAETARRARRVPQPPVARSRRHAPSTATLGVLRDSPEYRQLLRTIRFTPEFAEVTTLSNDRVADLMSLHPAFARAGIARAKAVADLPHGDDRRQRPPGPRPRRRAPRLRERCSRRRERLVTGLPRHLSALAYGIGCRGAHGLMGSRRSPVARYAGNGLGAAKVRCASCTSPLACGSLRGNCSSERCMQSERCVADPRREGMLGRLAVAAGRRAACMPAP